MELLKNTLYINLEQRTDRKDHVEQQLKILGINGERVPAVKTKTGCIGCTMSHIKCLKLAKERNYDWVFICEDDILFNNPNLFLENLNKFNQNYINNWDVVIVGGTNCPPYHKQTDYCIKVRNCQTTTGYIVKKHYYDTLIVNFTESVNRLVREPGRKKEFALDIYWKQLQQKDNWFMIIPPTVSQRADYSDIEERFVNYDGLMLDLDKEWLFRPPPKIQHIPFSFNP